MATYPNPLFEQFFASAEPAYGVMAYPSAEGAFLHTRAAVGLTRERAPREDRRGTRGTSEMVTRRRSLAYEIEGYAIPSAAAESRPDVDALLAAHALTASVPTLTTVAASPAPSTQSCALTNPAAVAAGQAFSVVIEGRSHLRVVSSVADGVLHWTAPLPVPPPVGAALTPAVAYLPTREPATSITLWRYLDGVAFGYLGCVGKMTELTLSSGDEARLRFEGSGAGELSAAKDVLQQSVNASDATFAVTDADRFSAEVPLRIGNETVFVASVDPDADTLTVIRGIAGTTAAAHSAGAILEPVPMARAVSGSPVAGIAGRVQLDGGDFEITRAKMRVEEGLRLRETFGTEGPSGFTHPARRKVTLTLSGFLTVENSGRYGAVKRFAPIDVMIQAGERAGGLLGLRAPRFEARIPEITAEAGQEVPLELTGVCLETNGDDEVALIFG